MALFFLIFLGGTFVNGRRGESYGHFATFLMRDEYNRQLDNLKMSSWFLIGFQHDDPY